MNYQDPPDSILREILNVPRTIAVVGCSPKTERDSHRIAAFLMARGHHVIPVNPGHRQILGQICYPSLLDIPEPVYMVDVFRRSQYVPEIAGQAIQIGAKVLWTQLGVFHEQAAEKATRAGLIVVMNRCPFIEYRRLQM